MPILSYSHITSGVGKENAHDASATQVKALNLRCGTERKNMRLDVLRKLIEHAKHPRWRKRHKKASPKFVRRSNLQNLLNEMEEDREKPPPHPDGLTNSLFSRRLAELGTLCGLVTTAVNFTIAAGMDGVDKFRKFKDRNRLRALLERRRSYYERENDRRRSERALIREAVPKPENRHPSPDELEEAYLRRRESDAWAERLGTLILDLEEHERRTVLTEGNRFTGSSGGVKAWLAANCPLLAKHYQTCQRYKRLVQDNPPDDASAA